MTTTTTIQKLPHRFSEHDLDTPLVNALAGGIQKPALCVAFDKEGNIAVFRERGNERSVAEYASRSVTQIRNVYTGTAVFSANQSCVEYVDSMGNRWIIC